MAEVRYSERAKATGVFSGGNTDTHLSQPFSHPLPAGQLAERRPLFSSDYKINPQER